MRWTIRLLRLALLWGGVAVWAGAVAAQSSTPPAPPVVAPPPAEFPDDQPPPPVTGVRPTFPPQAIPPAAPAAAPQVIPGGGTVIEITPANFVPAQGTPAAATLPGIVPGQVNDNPANHLEAAVSLEWIGPTSAKLGQPVVYQLLVRNITGNPVHEVVVRNKIGAGATVTVTE